MPKAYSADMRERVIAEVEGGASRREAAEEFEVSASTTSRARARTGHRSTAAAATYLNGGNWPIITKFTEIESGRRPDRPVDTPKELLAAHPAHTGEAALKYH
jgi:transposase-like protein